MKIFSISIYLFYNFIEKKWKYKMMIFWNLIFLLSIVQKNNIYKYVHQFLLYIFKVKRVFYIFNIRNFCTIYGCVFGGLIDCFLGLSSTMAMMFSLANKSRWHSNIWSLHFPALSKDSPLQCKQWNCIRLLDPVDLKRLLPCPRYTIWQISRSALVTCNDEKRNDYRYECSFNYF